MKISGFVLVLPLLAALATPGSARQTGDLLANGRNPDWFVSVGAAHIKLWIGGPWLELPPPEPLVFPPAAALESNGVTRWESNRDGQRIVIEVRDGMCAAGGAYGTASVHVRLGEREFIGCGDHDSAVVVD